MFGFSLHFKIPFTESFLKIEAKEELSNRPTLKAANPRPEIGPPPAFVWGKAILDAGGEVRPGETVWSAAIRALGKTAYLEEDCKTLRKTCEYLYAVTGDIKRGLAEAGFKLLNDGESEEDTVSAVMRLIGEWKEWNESRGHLEKLMNEFRVLYSGTWEDAINEARKIIEERKYLRAVFDQIIDDLKQTAGFEATETDDEAYLAVREILEGMNNER